MGQGNFEDDKEDKQKRLGPNAIEPKRIEFKTFAK